MLKIHSFHSTVYSSILCASRFTVAKRGVTSGENRLIQPGQLKYQDLTSQEMGIVERAGRWYLKAMPNSPFFGCTNPDSAKRQYVWRTEQAICAVDVKRVFDKLVKKEQAVHINTGTREDQEGKNSLGTKNEGKSCTGFLSKDLFHKWSRNNASFQIVERDSYPIRPTNANHVIDAWCFSANHSITQVQKVRKKRFQQYRYNGTAFQTANARYNGTAFQTANASFSVQREGALIQLRKLFNEHWIVAIVGDSGRGKSELAKQYAHEHNEFYHHIIWINGDCLERDYRNIATAWKLKIDGSESIKLLATKVHRVLSENTPPDNRSLIIFDNVCSSFISDNLDGDLPNHYDTLLTSRDPKERFDGVLDLAVEGSLSQEEAIEILKKGNEERFEGKAAKKIASYFENMPFALALVANHFRLTKRTMTGYLEKLPRNRKAICKEGNLVWSVDLFVMINMTVEALEESAKGILFKCAFLPSSAIPKKLIECFDVGKTNFDQSLLALGTLITFDKERCDMHPLIQAIVQSIIRRDRRTNEILSDIGRHCLEYQEFLVQEPRKALVIYSFCIAEEKRKGLKTTANKKQLQTLYFAIFLIHFKLGEYSKALKYAKASLANARHVYGEKHSQYGVCLTFVGDTLHQQGKYDKALQYLLRAFKHTKVLFGEHHPEFAGASHSVGLTLSKLGRHEEALKYFCQARGLRQVLLGEKHPELVHASDYVGFTLSKLGRHEEALLYENYVLGLRKDVLGEKHSRVALSLNRVGLTLSELGRHEEALKYFCQARGLGQVLLGKKHPDFVLSSEYVGFTLFKLGRHEEALLYMQQVLELRKELHGKNHLELVDASHSVGLTLSKLGRHEEALQYIQQVLELRKVLLGKNHPDFAISLNSVGTAFYALGKYEEALQYLQQALELRKELLGKNHPDFAVSLSNVGSALGELGRHEEALQYQRQALELQKELLGKNHPDFAFSLSKVGVTLGNLGINDEALKFLVDAFEVFCRSGKSPNHSHRTFLSDALACLDRIEDQTIIRNTKEQLFMLCSKTFGENHELTNMARRV